MKTDEVNPNCVPYLIFDWDRMKLCLGFLEFWVGSLAPITGSCDVLHVSYNAYPVVALFDFLKNLVPAKMSSTYRVIMATPAASDQLCIIKINENDLAIPVQSIM